MKEFYEELQDKIGNAAYASFRVDVACVHYMGKPQNKYTTPPIVPVPKH